MSDTYGAEYERQRTERVGREKERRAAAVEREDAERLAEGEVTE